MKKLHASIVISAPREKVWDTMLGDATYRQWTKPFHEGSYYKGSWEEGAKILFIGPNEEGEMGMVSRIKENRPYEFVSIEHQGFYKDGVEDTTSEEATKWTPAFENYTFRDVAGGTEVSVDVDVPEEYEAMFTEMWPKALQELKQLAEA
jgi:uncharacterized protein YndB with AHSA1/START domain